MSRWPFSLWRKLTRGYDGVLIYVPLFQLSLLCVLAEFVLCFSCTSCTNSDYPCTWCIRTPHERQCVFDRERCNNDVLVTGKSVSQTVSHVKESLRMFYAFHFSPVRRTLVVSVTSNLNCYFQYFLL